MAGLAAAVRTPTAQFDSLKERRDLRLSERHKTEGEFSEGVFFSLFVTKTIVYGLERQSETLSICWPSDGDIHTFSVNNFKSQKVSLCLCFGVRKPNAMIMLAC